MTTDSPPRHLDFIFKVASRCNLNCSYCYVYHRADDTWRGRPLVMPDEVFRAGLDRIRRHCLRSGQNTVRLAFHGGEPCLIGPELFTSWCNEARTRLGDVATVEFAIQTNGTLIDQRWVESFRTHDVEVGVSMDGPHDVHDAFRVDHLGRGSYEAVNRGLSLLRDGDVPFGVLSVVQLGADGLRIHTHFAGLGVRWIDYLLPGYTHDTIGSVHEQFGAAPCADFLLPILNHWSQSGSLKVRVRIFWEMARLILGGENRVDMFGTTPLGFVFVEADGAIEGLDILRLCDNGIAGTGLNVLGDDFCDIEERSELHRQSVFTGVPLPTGCRSCAEATTCGGGYLPHRYSRTRGFDNPSVWCEDLLKIFGRLRELLGVPVADTGLRRLVLEQMRPTARNIEAVRPYNVAM